MNSRGNAFVYILIAIVLLAGLTYTIGKSNDGVDPVNEMDENKAKIAANAIMAYAAAVQNAVVQLDQVGTDADAIDFILPDDVHFNDLPAINKLYHPDGGGLVYKHLPNDAAVTGLTNPEAGYYVGRFNNWYEWSPTAANDVIFAAYGITQPVCAAINKTITGSPLITTAAQPLKAILVSHDYQTGANLDMEVSECNACEDKSSLCIEEGGIYGFYSILVAR